MVLGGDLWNLGFGANNYSGGGPAADSAWTADSRRLRLYHFTRGAKKLTLAEVDGDTGDFRVLAADSSKTNVIGNHWRGPKSFWASDDGSTVVWWSERDGWAHLYRIDGATVGAKQPLDLAARDRCDEGGKVRFARRQLQVSPSDPCRAVGARAGGASGGYPHRW